MPYELRAISRASTGSTDHTSPRDSSTFLVPIGTCYYGTRGGWWEALRKALLRPRVVLPKNEGFLAVLGSSSCGTWRVEIAASNGHLKHLEVPIEEPLAAEVVDANMAMERNFDAMMAALSLSDLTAQPQHWNQPFCFKMQIGDLSLRFLLVRGQFQTCQCLPSQLNLTSSMPPLLESRPVTS